jgi:hypothetical protein
LTDEALHDDIQAFKKWIVSFEEKTGIPTYIFTNSPSHWCEMWLMPHRNMTHVKGIQAIFGSNHAMFQTTDDALLKPNLVFYRRMESYFSTQSDTLVFVDDSRSNLEPIASRPMWHPILFDSENVSTSTPTTFPSIQHLSELDASIVV